MNLIIKGFIIGIAKIIPGVSGSMLAITLGVYENIITSIAEIRKKFIKNTQFLSKIVIGIILSIIIMSKVIVKCLEEYYFTTMLLFIGMIIGGIPPIVKKIRFSKKNIIISMIVIIALFQTTNMNNNNIVEINYSLIDFIKLIGIGFLDAFSSIVPGISGTAILMTLGYYNIILETFSTLFKIEMIKTNIFIMIPFIIGFIIGVLIISKIINYFFKNKNNTLNILILILIILSTSTLVKNTFSYNFTLIELTLGMLLCILGYKITNKLEKMKN